MPKDQMVLAEPNGSALVDSGHMPSMTRILQMAMSQDVDANKLEKMMDMHFRWKKEEAREAYITAVQLFKANPPELNRTGNVNYPNKDGSRTKYSHVELHKANKLISESLRTVGLTATWKMSSDPSGRTFCTCVLTHAMGHVEEIATLSAPADTSGGKNSIQAIGSTTSYLERYTLLAGLGLTPEGMDDDGRTGEGLPTQAVEEYLTSIRDASSLTELQVKYEAAKTAASARADSNAVVQFLNTKDERYRQLKPQVRR